MSTARCAAGRLGGIPECRPSDDIAGHVAGRRDAPLVHRRCVRASVVSKVRTQGVRARSGAIACRCCSRIAPIATWRESTALKITPFRADQLPEFKGLLFEQAVDDRLCTLSAGGGMGSHLGTNDRRAHAPIRPRGSRCRVVPSLHGRWGHRKRSDQPVLFKRGARPHGGNRQDNCRSGRCPPGTLTRPHGGTPQL